MQYAVWHMVLLIHNWGPIVSFVLHSTTKYASNVAGYYRQLDDLCFVSASGVACRPRGLGATASLPVDSTHTGGQVARVSTDHFRQSRILVRSWYLRGYHCAQVGLIVLRTICRTLECHVSGSPPPM